MSGPCAPTSWTTGSRWMSAARADTALSNVAENRSTWRSGSGQGEDAPDRGEKAHVGHAVGLVDDDEIDVIERHQTRLDQILEPAGACHDEFGAGVERLALRAVADPAVHGDDIVEATANERPQLAGDLLGQLAVGARTRAVGRRRCAGRNRATSGRPKASVLPDPVGARPATSRPARASGMTADWMGNGSVIAAASRQAHRSAGTPRSANRVETLDMEGNFQLLNSAFGRNNGAFARQQQRCGRRAPYRRQVPSGRGDGEGQVPAQLIDERIEELDDWRGEMLSRLRAVVKQADPDVVEEWKWRGVPVWSHDGSSAPARRTSRS